MSSVRTYLVVHPGAELFGSDRMMIESVRGLTENGARVVVALPNDGPAVDELRASGASVVIIPIFVLRKALLKPSGWSTLIRDGLRGAAAAWRLLARQRPDAVYVSTITLPQWPVLARARRIPVVVHVHEAEAATPLMASRLLHAPLVSANSVIVNSEHTRRTVLRACPSIRVRTRLVANGIAGPSRVEKVRADVSDLKLLYIGRLSPRKGAHDAISAVASLRSRGVGATLTLAGSTFRGYEWYGHELQAAVAQLEPGVVQFVGFQPDVWPLMMEHDLVLVPSVLDESFGNTAVEAVLSGRPVVASDVSGLREAVGDYSTAWLVRPGAPEEIADAIVTVVGRWPDVSRTAVASAIEAQNRHAPAIYRQRITAILAQVVDATAPRHQD